MSIHVTKDLNNHSIEFEAITEWMAKITEANAGLPVCREALAIEDESDRMLFLLTVSDYASFADSENEGLLFETVDMNFPDEYKANNIRRRLRDGTHTLLKNGMMEFPTRKDSCSPAISKKRCFQTTFPIGCIALL